MSIEEGNKIIAEFMGLMANPYDNGRTYGIGVVVGTDGNYYADEWISPKYHSSWDCLMPVVKKIQLLPLGEFGKKKPVMNALMDVDMKPLFTSCVDFIQWYNSQASPTNQ